TLFQGCGSPTATPIPSPSPTSTPFACENYTLDELSGVTLVPGTNLVPGSQCNDCAVIVQLPFPYTFYDDTYSSVVVGSNGLVDFTGTFNDPFNECLPYPLLGASIAAFWDDLDMSAGQGSGLGIYTSV